MSWEGLNRRRFPRAQFPCLVKVIIHGQVRETILTHTENLALAGMCVILKKGLELFSSVGIELDLLDGEEPLLCSARIVWTVRRKATEEEKPSFYDTGIEFVDIHDRYVKRIERAIAHLVRVPS